MDQSFFTQDFDTFARGLSRTDLALYAGIGFVLYVVFKERLSPVQVFVKNLIDKAKSLLTNNKTDSLPVVSLPPTPLVSAKPQTTKEDVFFRLIASWKQTRDLAVVSGCDQAVKVADQMFPFLSPNGCNKVETKDAV